ncbi:glycoside hydrolase xylanase [Barnesiella sp. WM24]|uniref:PCMD domain-containing protein n=1 Tax=Barnesiella sp. WM24 TaxID=2558278 RepID=UPI00107171A8|nr:PCMD domain-containing protein [Barnesiella sp. WM24]TFU93414.1 glycoside hydrolase xylanase [Barnesiella sp. WM24]
MSNRAFIISCLLTAATYTQAQKVEPIKYGNFENWVTRNIPESKIIGGNTRQVYEIAPNAVINSTEAYHNMGGSPWATSNVVANVMGIVKASNTVFPDKNPAGGRCCKLCTMIEEVKVLGMVNLKVLVAGSIYLGYNIEPIRNTSSPYSKMEMGIPFTGRPKALRYDYRLEIPKGVQRIRATGTSSKPLPGADNAEVYILLQRRWEDADGNIYAKRVGTGRERYSRSTSGWVSRHDLPVYYGDMSTHKDYKDYMGLIPASRSYYAKNSKGKMVPVKEVGWDSPDATPTHLLVMASSGCGVAYEGTPGMTLWIDNIELVY